MLGLTLDILRAKAVGITGGGGGPSYSYTPPLDLYPADIAYSVRKLSSSYSGPCMEVERVVDAATLDIGFDSNGLLDTQAIIDFLVAGGGVQEARVRTWYDQTGNSRHARQTLGSEMSYIYGGGSIREVNGKPVVDPIYGGDGLYNIQGTYSTASNNTIFTVISPGLTGGSYVMSRVSGAFTQGILGAGIEEPISGWNAGIDFGFGTTQYYRDGTLYGSGTTLLRNDIMQSVLASRRIMGIGFTQSGLTEPLLRLGRDTSSSIYATQEYIVYFSDQLGTVPRTALEGNINSYYQVANLPDYTSGFLADYSGASAAYSVRKLSNTAIKCMRVRQTVPPFDELDIGFTPAGDLDEGAIVAFGAGNPLVVSRWYDQSGYSRHAVQDAPGNQPQIYDGASVITENGKPALSFNTSKLGEVDIVLNQAFSSTSVVRLTATPTFSPLFGSRDSGGVYGSLVAWSSTGSWTMQSGSLASTGDAYDSNQHLFFNVWNGASSIFAKDGGSAVTLNPGTNDWQNLSIGIRGTDSASSASDGLYQEFIFWDTDKNAAGQRPAIETNINTYYSVYPTSGLLVDYPGSYRAYSLRKLQNLAQYAIRVQRHSGAFDEQDIGFTPSGDLDTQAIIDFAGTDVVGVKTWYNQAHGSSAQDLTQSNTAYQPLIFDGTSVYQSNGKPAIYYDATDKQLADIASSGTGVNTDFFNVHQRNSGTGYFNHWEGSGGFQVARMTTQYVLGWLGGTTGPAVDTDQHVFTGIATGTTGQIRLDGTAYTPGTIASGRTFNGEFAIQGRPGIPGSNPGPGDIYHQEFIQYDFNNTGADVTAIETNINTYYGVYTMYNPIAPTSGFLFDYSGAEAAYSVRQLNNNATVAMRVRRTIPPYDELDIGFTPSGDLDTTAIDDFATLYGGNDTLVVSSWYDQSGNQIHVTQAAASQPIIREGTPISSIYYINGKAAIKAAERTGFNNTTFSNVSQPFTLTTVTSNNADSYLLGNNNQLRYRNTTDSKWLGTDVDGGGTIPTNDQIISFGVGNGSSSFGQLYAQSAQPSGVTFTNSSNLDMSLMGARWPSNSTGNKAWLQEFILWNTDQKTDGNQSGIVADTNSYFSTY